MSALRKVAEQASAAFAANAESSDVEIAARGMCRASVCAGGACAYERDGVACLADEFFGKEAASAIAALRGAGRMLTPPANRPCVERSESGSCLACDAGQGEPCAHPSLKL